MISVVIAVLNGEGSIGKIVSTIFEIASPHRRMLKEVIVVDGGSTDGTVAEALKAGATVFVQHRKDRVALLNYGAQYASGKILYFLNGHSQPPATFIQSIIKAEMRGHACGTFSLCFDRRHWLLDGLSWATRPARAWLSISEQSLFVTRELFQKAGGYREHFVVMGNQEIIKRFKRYADFVVLPDSVLVSAARYFGSGVVKTGIVKGIVFLLLRLGYAQNVAMMLYRKALGWKMGPEPITQNQASVTNAHSETDIQMIPLQH